MLAILPAFESRWDAPNAPEITEGGYFRGEPRRYGVRNVPITSAKPYHRQMTNAQYIDGSTAITRVRGLDQPAPASKFDEITNVWHRISNRALRGPHGGH
jgi:hypothetical protein